MDGPKLCLFERYVAYKYQNTLYVCTSVCVREREGASEGESWCAVIVM